MNCIWILLLLCMCGDNQNGCRNDDCCRSGCGMGARPGRNDCCCRETRREECREERREDRREERREERRDDRRDDCPCDDFPSLEPRKSAPKFRETCGCEHEDEV